MNLMKNCHSYCQFDIILDIEAGEYTLGVTLGGVSKKVNHGLTLFDTGQVIPIIINWDYQTMEAPFFGTFNLPITIVYP